MVSQAWVESRAEQLQRQLSAPALALGVVLPNGRALTAAVGVTRRAGSQPVTTSTLFSLQSISKTYTAMVVLAAAEQGRPDLDAPIADYLPKFTVNTRYRAHPERRITLRHLLSHTAGFTHEAPVGSNAVPVPDGFAEHIASIPSTWLRFEPGDHYEYSNLGIDLAGHIVAQVSGIPFATVTANLVLEPLGLSRTSFDQDHIAAEPDRAVGHDPLVAGDPPLRMPMVPAGGAYSSVQDACTFIRCHLNLGRPLLAPGTYAQMTAMPFPAPGQTSGYGLGLVSFRMNSRLVHGHSGGGFGFLAGYYWYPDHDVGVVMLRNDMTDVAGPDPTLALLEAIADEMQLPQIDESARTAPEEVGADRAAELAADYIGRSGHLTLSVESGRLQARLGSTAPYPVRSAGPERLVVGHTRLAVMRADGKPRSLVDLDSGNVWYRNHPAAIPHHFDASSFCGDYKPLYTGRAIGNARIFERDQRLWLHMSYGDEHDLGTVGLDIDNEHRVWSTTGEYLDASVQPIRYANVPLEPSPSGPDRHAGSRR
jgi:CubicO group peptidase (beta-lactamase class C family)